MKSQIAALITGTAICLAPSLADAHVDVVSGPAFADKTQEISFGVGHGCAGSDTYSIRVEIPAGITSVRALTSDFGPAVPTVDDAQRVTAVTWTKSAPILPSDTAYYKLVLRVKVPNQPFTSVRLPIRQICKDGAGTELPPVDWSAIEESADGGHGNPAPAMHIVPARHAGWNKWTVPQAVSDLSVFFQDAQIVWKGTQAYSANPATAELIAGTQGVQPLTALAAGDVIWVKY